MDVFLKSALSAEKKLQWKKENENIKMSSHFTGPDGQMDVTSTSNVGQNRLNMLSCQVNISN